MASVFAQIARARGATTAGASLLEALAKMRQQEEERRKAELEFQRRKELEAMRGELALRNLTAQTLLGLYSQAAGQGYITPADQERVNQVLSGFLAGQTPVEQAPQAFAAITGAAARGKEAERQREDVQRAQQLAAQIAQNSIRPEEADAFRSEVSDLINRGDITGVIAAAAKYGADENAIKAAAAEAGIELTQAQTQAALAGARYTTLQGDIMELTKDATVRKAFAEAGLAENQLKQAEALLPMVIERYGIQNRILLQDEQVKKLLARKAAVEARVAEATEQDQIDRLRKENERLDAQIELTLAQTAATKAREALDKQQYDQNDVMFLFETMDRTQKLITQSPEAAKDFIDKNKELFDRLGVGADSFKQEIDLVERLRRAQDPVTKNALDAILQAMPNPPQGDIEAELEKYRQMLDDTKLTPEEKDAWISTLRNAWWRVRQGMAIDMERARARAQTSGVDNLDYLKEMRQWLESERKSVESKIDAIFAEAEATGCIQRGPEDQVIIKKINPACEQTYREVQARINGLHQRFTYLADKERQVASRLGEMLGFGPTDNELRMMFEQEIDNILRTSGYLTPEDVLSVADVLNIDITRDEAAAYAQQKMMERGAPVGMNERNQLVGRFQEAFGGGQENTAQPNTQWPPPEVRNLLRNR